MQSIEIPVQRIFDKVDEYYSRDDAQGAEKHLLHWRSEAESVGDLRGCLSLENELMGLYRKSGRAEEAIRSAEHAIALISRTGMDGSESAATIYINCATVFTAFNQPERALELFKVAEGVYIRRLRYNDERQGSLYNNMASAYKDCGRFSEALECYEKALSIMRSVPHGQSGVAVTLLNMADTIEAAEGLEQAGERIDELVRQAMEQLEAPNLRHDGAYAFVCEKCAPAFDYYGYFFYAKQLRKRADEIYERT